MDGVNFVAKHSDDIAGLAGKADDAAEVLTYGDDIAGLANKANNATEALSDASKLADSTADVASTGSHVGNVAKTGEVLSEAGQETAAALAAAGGAGLAAGAVISGASKSGKAVEAVADAASQTSKTLDHMNDAKKAGSSAVSGTADATRKQTQDLAGRNCDSLGGDPIHMGTGDQLISHTALKLYGAATWPFVIHYHSGLLQYSEMGAAWTHNYAMSLQIEEGPSSDSPEVTVFRNASRLNKYRMDTDGVFRTEDIDARFDELHPVEQGYKLECRKNRETFLFSETGVLLEHVNQEGQALIAAYNERGWIEQLTDKITGRSLGFVYDESGLLTSVEDTERTVRFVYNDKSQMTRFIDANGNATDMICDEEGRILSVTVDGQLQFENTFDAQHRIVTQRDANGHLSHLQYDTESIPGQTVTTWTNPLGHQTKYVHDEQCLLQEIEYPDGRKVNYTYNEYGQEVDRRYSDGTGTSYLYDERGRQVQYTDELGHQTHFYYDEHDLLIKEVDAEGQATAYHYDEQLRLIGVTRADGSTSETGYTAEGQKSFYRDFSGSVGRFYYKNNGELEAWEDAEGRLTKIGLDGAGRITRVENALGFEFTREYDGNDNLIRTSDALGHTWEYRYNADDHLVGSKDPSGAEHMYTYTTSGKLASITNPLLHTIQYDYDQADRLVSEVNPVGDTTKLQYDAVDRLITVLDPLDRETRYNYDNSGRLQAVIDGEGRLVKQLTYDAAGNPVAVTNGLGQTNRYRFNHNHQITEENDAAGRVTRFKYDALARLAEVVEAEQAFYRQEYDAEGRITAYEDANRNRTELRYDSTGLLVEEKNASGNGIAYEYDLRGLLAMRINARRQSTAYRYDAAGRLIGLEDEVGQIQLDYDANGRVVSLAEGESVLSRVYDAAGRLISSTDTMGHTIGYAYDAADRLTMLTYPDGKQVHYRYNAAGEMVEVKDWRGRLTRYSYDRSGKLAETTRANGTRERRAYDAASRLVRIQDSNLHGIMLQQFRFTYNEIGQIIQEEDKQYTYDQLRRLSSGASQGRIVSYEYDLGGNLTHTQDSLNSRATTFQYAPDNRLLALEDYPVEMDADGNLLYKSNGESMASYEYDARNRLVRSGRARYTYNMLGTRTSMSWRGKTTQYVVDDLGELSRVLMELDEAGTPTAFYVYGLGLIGREDANGNYVSYHSDIRGSTTLLTDEQGSVTDRYTYGIYGELEQHEGSTHQPFQYNGRDGVMTDPNGLYYMRARYYDPQLKRFLNRDVILGDLTDGQTLNRFAYVNGDPVGYVDPLGLFKCNVEGTGDAKTYYHVTTKESAKEIMESQTLGRPGNLWESRVFAWKEQPTKSQAKAAGIGSRTETVLEFKTNASFGPDRGIVNPKIKDIAVETTDGQHIPIQIFDVKEVGFKKSRWKFWE
ncbi:RHS repeat-associated core domain-containing protein [Paenibacillus vini]|uniref:RHS repeat-associated core domain-containing protein n=1 Tax=Paenibacillus vini TaxID=1476024 RepID=UPI0025B65577|nr:RHS repeat-associated core domain-containing protein [Paenibacillus vini]MDN4066256.1 RHS repeat-associated core domain-containing protein [Paenibacillus vini]